MKLHKNQSGFSHIEIMLVVLVVVLIGATGWLVYDRQNSKQPKDNTAGQSEVVGHNGDESGLGDSVAQKYLTIKEWGVKFPYTGTDTFSYRFVATNSVSVISANLASKFGCTEFGAGGIERGKSSDIVGGSGGSITFARAYDNNAYSVGKLGEYYYSFSHDQAACNGKPLDGDALATAENNANDLVKGIVPKVTAE